MTDSLSPAQMAATHQAAFDETRAWSKAEFEGLLNSNFVFPCGDPRCFALIRVVADEAELLTIATHPDHQRRGLARRLMDFWQAEAARRGASQGFLEVAADNTAAQALYLSCGYEIIATRTGYYNRSDGTKVDANVLQRLFSAQS